MTFRCVTKEDPAGALFQGSVTVGSVAWLTKTKLQTNTVSGKGDTVLHHLLKFFSEDLLMSSFVNKSLNANLENSDGAYNNKQNISKGNDSKSKYSRSNQINRS